MNILMFTNTFAPHVGGVARSVEAFTAEFRRRGHRVMIVAPQFENLPADETDVIRVPALQKFNGSDFSVRLPLPGYVSLALQDFRPDIVHSHHPFLLGENAVRAAASANVPLVFTHHTMFEQYTHYVPGNSPAMQRFVIDLTSSYANLCERVFAPSESVAAIIRERGVLSPIEILPTGVDVERFARGDGRAFRRELDIPEDAWVVGHVGRLAPEKNLEFLGVAVATMLRKHPQAHFLVVGAGPSESTLRELFQRRKLSDRLHLVGVRSGQELIDAYHAMDVFAFSSQTETQGMVLTEAMAAGLPVVAIDAPGVREVVIDKQNGVLLSGPRVKLFASSLRWVAGLPVGRREHLRQAALDTAAQFSIQRCADRALENYQELIALGKAAKPAEEHAWEVAARMIGVEWELWSNVARAAGTMLQGRHLWKMPVLGKLARHWRRIRRWFSRNEWGIRLLKLRVSEGTAAEPGLILVQIDGFWRARSSNARCDNGACLFWRRSLSRERYQLHTFYSGMPSTTPAVQGELFYGVKRAVPAFGFRDHETGKVVWMLDPEPSSRVQSRLGSQGRGLLEGGSAYSDIYTGGAAEPHFCASVMGWGDMLRSVNPLAVATLAIWNIWSLVRTGGLMVLEFFLALFDVMRGALGRRELAFELKSITSRVAVSILLRDLITIGASIDAARGLPIIHVNFLGYDEQSHRRGPGSGFAHWSLKGIDRAIHKIWQAAQRSNRRDYQLWIYSDHGQETTTPYSDETGRSVHDAVAEVFHEFSSEMQLSKQQTVAGVQMQRAQWLGGGKLQKLLPKGHAPHTIDDHDQLMVVAIGPLGLIHVPHPLTAGDRDGLARRLVAQAKLPWVLTLGEDQQVWAYNERGKFPLPQQAAEILGADHPLLAEVGQDLAAICLHPDAGEFVFGGWRPSGKSLSFPIEHGAHAGPGREETRGFAMLPADAPVQLRPGGHIRPLDLRAAVFRALGRSPLPDGVRQARKTSSRDTVRVVTYNVHTCIGMDGKLSPARIARVIAQCDPDIVALQELDVGRRRTGDVDQAHAIARELEMEFHFSPALQVEAEQYGNAILTRHPARLVRKGTLPGRSDRPEAESRGALWVAITINGHEIQVLNTHLGLTPRERSAQVVALLGPEWLGSEECRDPVILCGDFNATPKSGAYKQLRSQLLDAQLGLDNHQPRRTFFSHYPLGRIDHIFTRSNIEIVRIDVPQTALVRVASDHLPLVAEFRVVCGSAPAPEEPVAVSRV